ncbi:MAG: carboxylating nicotinate-nucleotide diphosphorylase [Dehalococcoidia bacterium]|nr:carboxylating nicotinate-nucleotide diphosphorylase [Dehalococcoidia bacterium]
MSQLPPEVYNLIDAALSEDQAFNDPTTHALVPQGIQAVGMIRAKGNGMLAGIEICQAVFQRSDASRDAQVLLPDGSALTPGTDLARIEGDAGSILRAERVALNFLQRMSGIASDTNEYVKAIEGSQARIVDTRKTAPGHRYLDKYAVRMGGGYNHRLNLADGILIKDNHIEALRSQEMGLQDVIKLALSRASHTIKVEVEVESLEAAEEAAAAGAHIIMLDNMSPELMRQAMEIIDGRSVVEASGGISMETVRAVAASGVDLISVGGLTHSTKALDISLDLEYI